ncbi:response regulator transcription factor [Pseudorhodoferax sp. Leaf274]|uniref:response regulator transcription factor n=1 Tax=Pseudorhodoferax sp. Leaf274 TaxID=1736318 RepID=UPI000703BC14|nr:response regulator [Pseudorhodoferax sp. Leaf274]KQP37392.1 histidine kinase [Pseudorhodoferax sp. Leaf274]
MQEFAGLVSALASLAWPALFAFVLVWLRGPIAGLIASAKGRKFKLVIAGNELSMEEAAEQQSQALLDLQAKVAELEKRLGPPPEAAAAPMAAQTVRAARAHRVLWVDDNPRNNSYLIAALLERGVEVDTALTTDEGLARFAAQRYDVVVSDMGRPEGRTAGIDLVRKLRAQGTEVPLYIYCSADSARRWRDEALQAGASDITASGSSLLGVLP